MERSWSCYYEYNIEGGLWWLIELLEEKEEDFTLSSEGDWRPYGFVWWPDGTESPEMDFEHYSYLIAFASEAEKLTWNVWDTWDPLLFGEGRKWGTLTYGDDIDPHKIYIYRFPCEAIENHDDVKWVD